MLTAASGHRLAVGVTRAPDDLAITIVVSPERSDFPIVLDEEQSRELAEALNLVRREVADRLADRWPRGRAG
jgi:hypothetical protein